MLIILSNLSKSSTPLSNLNLNYNCFITESIIHRFYPCYINFSSYRKVSQNGPFSITTHTREKLACICFSLSINTFYYRCSHRPFLPILRIHQNTFNENTEFHKSMEIIGDSLSQKAKMKTRIVQTLS